jgi:hypothetical protein
MLWFDPAILQFNGPVGHSCQFPVMGDDDQGFHELFSQCNEQPVQFLFVLTIQIAGRLIKIKDGRVEQ